MMRRLDTLIDTRRKRSCMLCLMAQGLLLVMLVSYLLLGLRLLACREYADLFALFQRVELSWTYLSRIVIGLVGQASIQLGDIFMALISSLRFLDALTLLLWCGMLSLKVEGIQRICKWMGFLFLISGGASILVLCIGFLSTTLLQVVHAVSILGGILVCFSLVCSMLCLYMILYKLWPMYQEALSYTVEEIEKG